MATLRDQAQRDAFIQDVRGSYSVIAPAGVGKTESIIRRIEQQAALAAVLPEFSLEKLVVVTYTEAAAAEMRVRAHAKIKGNKVGSSVLQQFEQATFSTIHAYASTLVRKWGSRCGIPSEFEIVQESQLEGVFREFLNNEFDLLASVPGVVRSDFIRLVDINSVMRLALSERALDLPEMTLPDLGVVDIEPVLNTRIKGRNDKLDREKAKLADWLNRFEETSEFVGLPDFDYAQHTVPGGAFVEATRSLFDWTRIVTQQFARSVALAFYSYRLSVGRLTFGDLTRAALDLVENPTVSEAILSEDPHILLDEAQDTDPLQFKLLLRLVGVEIDREATIQPMDDSMRNRVSKGRFCMVGDFQQSIYRGRANLSFYRTLHTNLLGEALIKDAVFSVTFRCDAKIIDWVNRVMPNVFSVPDSVEPVDFVRLEERPGAGAGSVGVINIEPLDEDSEYAEAHRLAEYLRGVGVAGLGIPNWSQCALLFARKKSIRHFQHALEEVGISSQVLSETRTLRDVPEYAWWVALIWVFAEPRDSFEISGILRDVFGVPDSSLFEFVDKSKAAGEGDVVHIAGPCPWQGGICDLLSFLHAVRVRALSGLLIELVDVIDADLRLSDRLACLPEATVASIQTAKERVRLELRMQIDRGRNLSEIAENMKYQFLTQRKDTPAPRANSVQLLTCHKAKGLQWEVVIVTSLASKIGEPGPVYPSLVTHSMSRRPQVLLAKSDPAKDALSFEKQRANEELRRLFYVAVTRAKSKLILVDDTEVVGKRSRGLDPFMSFLPDGWSRETSAIQEVGEPEGIVSEDADPVTAQSEPKLLQPLDSPERFRGASFTTPSQIKDTEDSDIVVQKVRSSSGIQGREYGLLWHAWMESLWSDAPLDLADFVGSRGVGIRERLERESALLREHPELATVLEDKKMKVRCEVPFFWREPDTEIVFNGVIDWLAVGEGRCWIIDWKTDIVDEGLELLMERYAEQVRVYRQAFEFSTGYPVRLSLYSTRLGQLIDVD